MKIKELLKIISRHDSELDVVVQCRDGHCYDLMDSTTEGHCHNGKFTEVELDKNINTVKLEID